MNNQNQEKEELDNQNGDPGRTPGAAEGDRETVEADLQEKQADKDSENYEKTKEKKVAESAA
jgi:hypothetical protein